MPSMPSSVADEFQSRRNEAVQLTWPHDREFLLKHISDEESKWLGSDEQIEGKFIPYNTDNRTTDGIKPDLTSTQ